MLIMTNDEHINDYGRIVKYHEDIAGFDFDEIRKIKSFLYRNYNYVTITRHFTRELMSDIHHFTLPPIDNILKYGEVFEYKMFDNKYLYRLAIRLKGKHFDSIYVIQPIYYENGIYLKLITCYTNAKSDNHITLNVKRYI